MSSNVPRTNAQPGISAPTSTNPNDLQTLAAFQAAFSMAQSAQQQQPQTPNAAHAPQPPQQQQASQVAPQLLAQPAESVSNAQWPGSIWPAMSPQLAQFAMIGLVQQLAAAGGLAVPNSIFADAQKFSQAILPSEGYDAAVADRLRKAEAEGVSAKDALHGMHGEYNHSANLWIDYYLDRKKIIDKLVAAPSSSSSPSFSSAQPVRTVKKPTFGFSKSESASAPPIVKREKTVKAPVSSASGPSASVPSARSSRNTANSMSSRYFCSTSKADKEKSVLPPPPSREPSPPTTVVRHTTNRGNAFTEEDNSYLIQYVSWATSRNPNIPKSKIIRAITRKAPHHPEGSWAAKWQQMPIVDEIYQNAGRSVDNISVSGSEEEAEAAPLRTPKRRRISEPSTKKSALSEDIESMAQWVSQHFSDWKAMSDKMRWKPFTEENPKKTHLEWAELYTKHRSDVITRAKEIRGKMA
ncbi:hypothetical protein K488DRAFT_81877 [Vararia minispora EC-137]|uniref:Uncharacterized protein n=1 Tax=Vararia minispora EC-137 TaxID=1314806 RepID=A0ACB8QY32_9AGAM|nr:hypothetical protein K488DRAFT_81877 [Vararia minispora EC-137]